jgi:hypothetical protein
MFEGKTCSLFGAFTTKVLEGSKRRLNLAIMAKTSFGKKPESEEARMDYNTLYQQVAVSLSSGTKVRQNELHGQWNDLARFLAWAWLWSAQGE